MSLSEQVYELEEDLERLKDEVRCLEENLNEVEQDLEDAENELVKLREFKAWVDMAYPVVVKDYESVKLIEEVANGL